MSQLNTYEENIAFIESLLTAAFKLCNEEKKKAEGMQNHSDMIVLSNRISESVYTINNIQSRLNMQALKKED
jgi:hypothetical protein